MRGVLEEGIICTLIGIIVFGLLIAPALAAIEVETTGGYITVEEDRHTKLEKAMANAINKSLACKCEVIIQQPDIRVKATETVEEPSVVKVSWTSPTSRENGDDLPAEEIGGYKLYIDGEPIDVVSTATSLELRLPAGYHVLSIATVDVDGLESTKSDEVTVTLKS